MKIVKYLSSEQFMKIIKIARNRGIPFTEELMYHYREHPMFFNFACLGPEIYQQCVQIAKEIGHCGELRDWWPEGEIKRCSWVDESNKAYCDYHDFEWGKSHHDDCYLFELLVLESFQTGLSWECILNKREAFRKAFAGFDCQKVAAFDDAKVNELCNNPDIVRHRGKISAAVNNAKIFVAIQKEFGSFDKYIWGFTDNNCIVAYMPKEDVGILASISTAPFSLGIRTIRNLPTTISNDLKKRGMKFVGTSVIFSYLQAIGIIRDHDRDCFYSKYIK